MPNTFFKNTNELLAKFDLENEEYFDPLALGDRKVAFSVKRPYPENIRYKPAQSRTGKPDNVAAIWVVYTHPNESTRQLDPEHVPIRVHVSNFSQYRSNHFDYDYEDDSEDTPTEDSVEKSLATPQPIGLEYPEEFFYDHTRDSFLDENGALLSGIEVLNRVYSEHCNTIHWLKGIKLKWKLFLKSKSAAALSLFIIPLIWILKWVFGRTIEENAEAFAYLKGYNKEDYKKLNTDSLNFFGYKASKSVIILFCVLSILGASWQYCTGTSSGYITYIGTSNYLTIAHSLFLLWLLDVIVPYFIFKIINILIKFRTLISRMRLKT